MCYSILDQSNKHVVRIVPVWANFSLSLFLSAEYLPRNCVSLANYIPSHLSPSVSPIVRLTCPPYYQTRLGLEINYSPQLIRKSHFPFPCQSPPPEFDWLATTTMVITTIKSRYSWNDLRLPLPAFLPAWTRVHFAPTSAFAACLYYSISGTSACE